MRWRSDRIPLVVSPSNRERTGSSFDRPVLSETAILRPAQDERRVEGFRTSVFGVLCRAFFERFFASESVTSDVQLRQTLIWVLAFLLTPGVLLLLQLFPAYQYVVIRAIRFHTYDIVDDMLEWIAGIFVVYSMVTVGLATVFVWDTLSFDHRDAMVLGPLPLKGRTIITAKLVALGVFLLAAALPMNLLNAFF